MGQKRHKILISTMLFILAGCLEPYLPPVTDAEVNFLVVDGYVNISHHTVTVTLSRAVVLWKAESPKPETEAEVFLEEESGDRNQLSELGGGKYAFTSPALASTKQYRLYIHTTDGKEYRSQYITPKNSPPIDELNWYPTQEGVQITVSSHDPSAQTRYYRWEFLETWEYRSALNSTIKLQNGVPTIRSASELINICFRDIASAQIHTGTTVRLNEDRISDYKLTLVPRGSQKISTHYSILVTQYGISKEAYDYWEELKKTTETLGGLFDPQPSKVTGNITNIDDPSETIIGYFDGGAASEKRIFILYKELPQYLRAGFPFSQCEPESIAVDKISTLPSYYILVGEIIEGITVVGYSYSTAECVDCRYQGGTTVRPDFWPR